MALASVGPTASIAISLAALVAACSYASPIVLLVCALPMLGIALAYRRLNQARVSCGATYVWAGRAISPYFGFLVGWLTILAYFFTQVAVGVLSGPYVLALFSDDAPSKAAQAIVAVVLIAGVGCVAYLGVRGSARLQLTLVAFEYVMLAVLAVLALHAVFAGTAHAVAFHWSWLSWKSLGGTSGFLAGAIIAIFLYSGWDAAILMNEETEDPETKPGVAVVMGVLVAACIFVAFTFAYEGAARPAALQQNAADVLQYLGQVLGGAVLAKAMVVVVIMSIVGVGLATISAATRMTFAMADDRVLPSILARTDTRFKTPAVATVVLTALSIIVVILYFSVSTLQHGLAHLISVLGLLFALVYAATGLAMAVYYRRMATTPRAAAEFLVVPLSSVIFLLYLSWRTVPGLGGWTGGTMEALYVAMAVGLVLMVVSRLIGHAPYYEQEREVFTPPAKTDWP